MNKEGARVNEVRSTYVHREGWEISPLSGVIGLGASLVAFRIRHSRNYKYVSYNLDLHYRKFR